MPGQLIRALSWPADGVVVQACTAAMSAKDCLELTRHAQQAGADIVYLQTPMMEAHGGEGVLKFFRYIADRTDIALGMFNSPSSGYVLTPAESARIYDEVPAVCATKEGAFRPMSSRLLHELASDLVIWECDLTSIAQAGCGQASSGTRAGHSRLSVRNSAAANTFRVLGPDLERPADRGNGLRGEVRARPIRCGHAFLVHLLSRQARLFHALGRRIQVRGVAARPTHRGLSAFAVVPLLLIMRL